ncbi:protein TBATA isoform X3 [Homo sapiens]|uniref:protein TBATA isoform X3 n=1 Tax=Homo sapiens TaxID=9606 RepID=UPI0007DC6C49|nr:protein TBATA isoform X3 [Homo sapiens]|eukprot:XP_016871336.1 protein TBATA isoform X3 [Homo sapiens]
MATDVQLADYPLMSPKAELKLEKKSGRKPRSPRDSGPQKELVIPGIVDFERIRRALRTPKPQTPGTYCFGRLSHHSFFSRHHPHPQHVTHIQDLTGKPVCVVRDFPAPLPESTVFSGCQMGIPTISVPIGDPQSNRNPQLSSEAWKKELKELASRVAFLTKEDELKKKEDTTSLNWNCKSRRPQAPGLSGTDLGAAELGIKKEQKEEPLREQGAKYSAETGRLIPASTRAVGRRRSHQGQQSQSSSRHEGVQAFLLQDQELLVLELLCRILETDLLSAIQFWLLYAPPKEKDLALGLLQTAVAQLLPQPLVSIPTEKLLSQLPEVHEPPQEKQEPPCRWAPHPALPFCSLLSSQVSSMTFPAPSLYLVTVNPRRKRRYHLLQKAKNQVGFPPRSPAELRAGAGLDSDLPLSTHTSTCSSQVGAPPSRSSPACCLSSH